MKYNNTLALHCIAPRRTPSLNRSIVLQPHETPILQATKRLLSISSRLSSEALWLRYLQGTSARHSTHINPPPKIQPIHFNEAYHKLDYKSRESKSVRATSHLSMLTFSWEIRVFSAFPHPSTFQTLGKLGKLKERLTRIKCTSKRLDFAKLSLLFVGSLLNGVISALRAGCTVREIIEWVGLNLESFRLCIITNVWPFLHRK